MMFALASGIGNCWYLLAALIASEWLERDWRVSWSSGERRQTPKAVKAIKTQEREEKRRINVDSQTLSSYAFVFVTYCPTARTSSTLWHVTTIRCHYLILLVCTKIGCQFALRNA